MNPYLALIVFLSGIAFLFYLDRDPKVRFSWPLLAPMIWLAIGGSRVLSEWLNATTGTTADTAYLEGNPLDRNVQAVLMVFAIVVLCRRSTKVGKIIRANWPILLFFVYCGISVLWSDFPATAVRRWIKAMGDVIMVLVVLTDADPLAFAKLPARIGFILLPGSVLLNRYFPEFSRGFDPITGAPVYTGVATSKNSLGMICLMFGLASVWRFLDLYRSKDRPRRKPALWAHSISIVFAIGILATAHSMTSLLCFLIAVGVMVLMGYRSMRRRGVAHLLVWGTITGMFCVLFLGFGSDLLKMIGRDPSLTGRTDIWRNVLGFAVNPLVGAGYESFWLGPRLEQMWKLYVGINQAHNGYIEIYLNLGWIGLILLGGIILFGYRNVIADLRRSPNQGRFKVAYFIVGVVYNFTEASFKMMAPLWVLFLMVTCAVPQAATRAAAVSEAPSPDSDWPYHTELQGTLADNV